MNASPSRACSAAARAAPRGAPSVDEAASQVSTDDSRPGCTCSASSSAVTSPLTRESRESGASRASASNRCSPAADRNPIARAKREYTSVNPGPFHGHSTRVTVPPRPCQTLTFGDSPSHTTIVAEGNGDDR